MAKVNSFDFDVIGEVLVLKAPAKINLRLKVLGRRPDGYHLLSMLNCPISLMDEVKLSFVREKGVTVQTHGAAGGLPAELNTVAGNLASRAAAAFLDRFQLPVGVQIDLYKRIPVGAGLGGGSSDAGAVLRALGARFRDWICGDAETLGLQRTLAELALELGADVPFFLAPGFASVGGIGEQIEVLPDSVPLPPEVLLVLPPLEICTTAVFALRRKLAAAAESQVLDGGGPLDPVLQLFCLRCAGGGAGTADLLGLIENDLLYTVREYSPQLAELWDRLNAVPDCRAGLSGSGSALFLLPADAGLFSAEAQAAVRVAAQTHGAAVRRVRLLANL